MKIEHEIKDVGIVRGRSIAEALAARAGSRFFGGLPHLLLNTLSRNKPPNVSAEERELAEVLHEPLWKEYEGERICKRTLALASLDKGMSIRECYRELGNACYYPASISEGMSYLSARTAPSGEAGLILHLGTILRIEYREYRLLTRKNSAVALVAIYPATQLKPHYKIVVVKKGSTQQFSR